MKAKASEALIEEVEELSPSQAYFWTRQRQCWEREADRAKAKGKLLGDGTIKELLKTLKVEKRKEVTNA